MIRLPRTGVVFLLFAAVLYLVALQSRSGLLFLILGLVAGCYALTAWQARCAVKGVEITPPERMAGAEGQRVRGTWRVCNRTRRPSGLIVVSGPWGNLFSVGVMSPDDVLHITPDLCLPARGVYSYSALAAASRFPFGLVEYRRTLDVAGEVIVFPAAYECVIPRAAGYEPMVGGTFAGHNRSLSGDRFHGVRPHLPRDPVKLIHWPSSSKGLGLMVREFDEELSGRLAIILDVDTGEPESGAPTPLLDDAARAAASLMLAALDAGHQIQFISLGDLVPFSVPPFADGDVVLEQLARARPRSGTRSGERLERAFQALPRKAGLALVLAGLDGPVAESIRRLATSRRSPLSLYVPEAAEQVAAVSGTSTYVYSNASIEPADPRLNAIERAPIGEGYS